jgi:hypothetical protein
MRWLTEGDANTNFFHTLANKRKRKKLIISSNHFKSSRTSRPNIGNLDFKSLSELEANLVVATFSEEEIK